MDWTHGFSVGFVRNRPSGRVFAPLRGGRGGVGRNLGHTWRGSGGLSLLGALVGQRLVRAESAGRAAMVGAGVGAGVVAGVGVDVDGGGPAWTGRGVSPCVRRHGRGALDREALGVSVLSRQFESSFGAAAWQPEVTALLDEHHLVAWSESPRRRLMFAATLARFLEGLRDAELVSLYGRHIVDVESLCYQMERAIPGGPLDRQVGGPTGLASLLRARDGFPGRPASKFRYIMWHDADTLVREDHGLFGQAADALAGVSAELEYVSDDALLIQRVVYVGGPLLSVYAENPRGQLRSWLGDGQGEAFWRVVTGVERPSVRVVHIDKLLRAFE